MTIIPLSEILDWLMLGLLLVLGIQMIRLWRSMKRLHKLTQEQIAQDEFHRPPPPDVPWRQ